MVVSAAGSRQNRRMTKLGTTREVFTTFLRLGLTSFGGPIAHLGYFRREFVERRGWLTESTYAQLIALCQFLPGPASSQLGFSIGLLRGGWAGAIAAFLAFTLPSALAMYGFAVLFPQVSGPTGAAAVHGLKIVALVVVAHAVMGMARRLCPDPVRATIAAMTFMGAALVPYAWVQVLLVAAGAMLGMRFCPEVEAPTPDDVRLRYGRREGWVLVFLFGAILAGLPFVARGVGGGLELFEAFYRAGALVFGGGHVVLPLLEETVVSPGWISADEFLAGYGAAQAVPGPLFSFSAYLGARIAGGSSTIVGSLIALVGIFLPGFLLVSGVLPFWRSVAGQPLAARAIAGVNAAVVGLLGASLYDPVWTSAVVGPVDVAIGVAGFTLLAGWRVPAIVVVVFCVVSRIVATLWMGA